MSPTGIGAALRVVRRRTGLTVEQVAEVAGISPIYLACAERGEVNPSSTWLRHVVGVIGDHLVSKGAPA